MYTRQIERLALKLDLSLLKITSLPTKYVLSTLCVVYIGIIRIVEKFSAQ